jgi:hypothetical protein
MLRRLLALGLLLAIVQAVPVSASSRHATPAPAAANSGQLAMFTTEAAAQAHCPKDEVVWLNTNSGIYHEKGMRWYGRTKHGAFVCRKEADSVGDRSTRNGQ